jgi:hypothetical protein
MSNPKGSYHKPHVFISSNNLCPRLALNQVILHQVQVFFFLLSVTIFFFRLIFSGYFQIGTPLWYIELLSSFYSPRFDLLSIRLFLIPVKSSLIFQSLTAALWSSAESEILACLFLTKYFPLIPSTSKEEAK